MWTSSSSTPPHQPTPTFFLILLFFYPFLFLSAVRMHTSFGQKESKIDHTSNWSRCAGTGSSSRADLSHAGKIMHPELTAQHTRLPITSLPEKKEEKEEKSSCCTIGCKRWDSLVPIFRSWRLIGRPRMCVFFFKADLMNVFGSGNGGSFNVSCGLLAMA